MGELNVLCEREEQTVVSSLFEELKSLLQDSDAVEEKDKIKDSLRKMTENTTYMVLGENSVGKTSLMRVFFSDILPTMNEMASDICEYRWGEQEMEVSVDENFQKRFIPQDNMRGISIIDTKGVNIITPDSRKRIKELAEKCTAIFVVFSAENVRSSKLWDLLESFPQKKMLFIVTKSDLVSSQELDKNLKKVSAYMKDSNISASLFPVSITEDGKIPGTVPLEEVRLHVKNNVVGKNPILNRQRGNIEEMKKMLVQLQKSFELRKKQYEADSAILQKINVSMDEYVANHKTVIENFTQELAREINKDIDNYQNEIISKMDPHKIKERFRTKEDFTDYLNMVNENYKNMMNESVNRKTIEAIKGCLRDLEIVFKEAVGYFNKRENILALNDQFYGSMSQSRNQMVAETKNVVMETGEFYQTLSDAAEELFLQIWHEREKYDAAIRTRRTLSTVTGSGTLGTAGAVGAVKLGIAVAANAGKVAGILVGGIAGVALVGIGVIVGAALINSIAKRIFDPKAEAKMEENTRKCIEEFKAEVENTRKVMVAQVTDKVASIFEKELASVDGYFTEFRMSVNIDEKKIPVLEKELEEALGLMQKVHMIEERVV